MRARDAGGALRAGDALLAVGAGAVAGDHSVRLLFAVYLMVLQVASPPPPPPLVLIGHAGSLTPY